jgi:hypothetical protein
MLKYSYLLLAGLLMLGACSQSSDQEAYSDELLGAEEQLERVNTAAAVEKSGEKELIPQEEMITLTPKEAFAKQYPGALKVKWKEDEHGNQEASFEMDGEKYRADYSPEGEWIETESSLKYEVLPMAVQKVIEERYNKEEITEIERVQHPSKGVFYDIEFKREGKNQDVEIKENGEIINGEGINDDVTINSEVNKE